MSRSGTRDRNRGDDGRVRPRRGPDPRGRGSVRSTSCPPRPPSRPTPRPTASRTRPPPPSCVRTPVPAPARLTRPLAWRPTTTLTPPSTDPPITTTTTPPPCRPSWAVRPSASSSLGDPLGRWQVTAPITVTDPDGAPVAGAVVEGRIELGRQPFVVGCTTDAAGVCNIEFGPDPGGGDQPPSRRGLGPVHAAGRAAPARLPGHPQAMSHRSRTASRRGRNDDGATLVEFAFVAPIFFLIIFGILEFGLVYRDLLTTQDAVNDAARAAAIAANNLGALDDDPPPAVGDPPLLPFATADFVDHQAAASGSRHDPGRVDREDRHLPGPGPDLRLRRWIRSPRPARTASARR